VSPPSPQQPTAAAGTGEGEHCEPEHGCITCGDVAVPLRVELIDAGRGLALCEDEQGRRETVEIALVEPVAVGEHLLVHAGTAIARVAPAGQLPRLPGREVEQIGEVPS